MALLPVTQLPTQTAGSKGKQAHLARLHDAGSRARCHHHNTPPTRKPLMTSLWRYCAHCDDWHLTHGHGVACTNHGDLVQFVSAAVPVLPPGVRACPDCLDLDEHEVAVPRRRDPWADLQAFIVRSIDMGIQDLADEQQILDMIAEGSPVEARGDP